jgi:transcriptional regulator with GAF, ATPase, and Fis domain/tetratricopeptide (TPR) repeat protein
MPIQLTLQGEGLIVEAPVGAGATSVVWRCQRTRDGMRGALKLARRAADERLLAEEAERLVWAQSEGLPVLLGAGKIRGSLSELGGVGSGGALLLGWVEGQPLHLATAERRSAGRAWSDNEVLEIALGLAAALADLHLGGVAHGDVKPENVLVERTATGLQARLVDLGLGAAADSEVPRGGTRRYLAPEVTSSGGSGDGRKRDLFALGLLLAELLEPAFADLEARDILPKLTADRPLSLMLAALLSACPGARPSAFWVQARARALLGTTPHPEEVRARRVARIRRAYLSVRRDEIRGAARASTFSSSLHGMARDWVGDARELLVAIDELRSGTPPTGNAVVLGDADASARLRFLVELIGPVAASWPIDVSTDDGALLARLCELTERLDPHAFTLAQLGEGASNPDTPSASSPVELSLLLWDGLPRQDVLEEAETYALSGRAPEAFRLSLGRRLRCLGHFGRALVVFGQGKDPLLAAEAAETARRAGDVEGALARIAAFSPESSPVARARFRSTQARIELDRGASETALSILVDVEETAAVLEVRALAELAQGRRDAALATLERAKVLAMGDEERARVESLLGMLHHASARATLAVESFRRAVEFAARAGAVLEEATYLTGLAAAAVEASRIEDALFAAERATALFEVLGRGVDAARAALNHVAALVAVGAASQARLIGDVALTLAKRAKDDRCAAYVHLELADVLAGDRDGAEHADRALRLLGPLGDEERLMAMTRALEHRRPVDVESLDGLARSLGDSPAVCLDYFGARCRVALANQDFREAEMLVGQLTRLLESPVASARRGRALSAGVGLAIGARLGDVARRLLVVASSDAQKLIAGCPDELRTSVLGLPWIRALRMPTETLLSSEQIADIESLVHALGSAETLRPLLVQVLDALVLWTGVERGLLLLCAPGGRLVARVGRNLGRRDLVGHQLTLSHSLALRAIEEGEPIVAVDASGELGSIHESVHALKLRSVLAVPLLARGEALGVVYLDDRVRRGAFGPKELAWVRLVAAVASVAIAEARDRLRLRRAVRKAERAERRAAELLSKREVELGEVRVQLARSREERPTRHRYQRIIGNSQAMCDLLRLVDRVVLAEVPVLVLGESGTGKELIARAIHENGPRAKAAFVAENCGALPEPLLESALFGHVKGAFTGAMRARAGLFEVAHEGTLFLDEVAEMSLGMQTKLLRVLEEGEFWPVGAERSRKVDVRVIAATHRDLEAMVRAGSFRQDLYYRLHVVALRVPPLRERHGDVPLLVEHFLERYARGLPIQIESRAMELLCRYEWPGNVRQLENELRRAIVLSDDAIRVEDLSDAIRDAASTAPARPSGLELRTHVEHLERRLVGTAMERTSGNQTRAAELLGVSRFGLQKMLRRLGIRAGEEPREVSERGARVVGGSCAPVGETEAKRPSKPQKPGVF